MVDQYKFRTFEPTNKQTTIKMKVTLTKTYKYGSTETVTVDEVTAINYISNGFINITDKVSFSSKTEEDNAWMERFGN